MIQDLIDGLIPHEFIDTFREFIDTFHDYRLPLAILIIFFIFNGPAKLRWLLLMFFYKKNECRIWECRHFEITVAPPLDLAFEIDEEVKLRRLSEATAFFIDADGQRCDNDNSAVLQVVELPRDTPCPTPHSNYLFIRDFYPRLAQRILLTDQPRRCVLMGNPGVSKSFFHWYVYFF